jgi:hypothetical protein
VVACDLLRKREPRLARKPDIAHQHIHAISEQPATRLTHVVSDDRLVPISLEHLSHRCRNERIIVYHQDPGRGAVTPHFTSHASYRHRHSKHHGRHPTPPGGGLPKLVCPITRTSSWMSFISGEHGEPMSSASKVHPCRSVRRRSAGSVSPEWVMNVWRNHGQRRLAGGEV